MTYYPSIVRSLTGLTLFAFAAAVALGIALASGPGRKRLGRALEGRTRLILALAWVIPTVAMAGSLYLSEVVGFAPCVLCWYQRIAMYPLALILAVALLRGDAGVWRYALPLPVIGVVISLYHIFIQFQPEAGLVPCGTGPPCTGRYLFVLGFVSIPVMAGAAFLLLIALLLALRLVERGYNPYRT